MNKSIFHEAKLLARTFEELALKTSSGCKFILYRMNILYVYVRL